MTRISRQYTRISMASRQSTVHQSDSVGATLVLIVYNLVFAWAPREVIPMFVPLVLVGGLPGGIYGALWWYFHRRHRQDA